MAGVTAVGLEPVGSQPGARREMSLGTCNVAAARPLPHCLDSPPSREESSWRCFNRQQKRMCINPTSKTFSNTALAEDKGLR